MRNPIASWLDRRIETRARAMVKDISQGWVTLTDIPISGTALGSKDAQLKAYQNHVYKCVNVIKNRSSAIPWKLVYRRGNEEADVKSHPFYDLTEHPNPIWTFRQLMAFIQIHLDLCGRGFFRLIVNGAGRPQEIWPLVPSNFSKIIPGEDSLIGAYEFYIQTGQGRVAKVVYPANEIVDFRYPHPYLLLEGASPIQQMAYSYDMDLSIRKQQRNFFRNAARPDLVFETADSIVPEQADQFLAKWNEKHQGVDRKWMPAVLGSGLKAHVLNIANTDLELLGLMDASKEDILEAYGVPAGKLGTVKDVNKANQLGIDQAFNEECIQPRLILQSETITLQLLHKYDPKLMMAFDSPVPSDKEFQLKRRETHLKNYYRSINEERAVEGLDPVPWGDQPWMPLMVVQPGMSRPNGEGAKQEKRLNQDVKDNLYELHQRHLRTLSGGLERWLKRYFGRLRKEVEQNLEDKWKRVEGETAGMSDKRIEKWIEDRKDVWGSLNFDLKEAQEEMKNGALPFVEAHFALAFDEALGLVGADIIAVDWNNPAVIDFLRRRENLLVGITDDIFEGIKAQLIEGIKLGESVGQLQQRLLENTWNLSQTRALRIARTETGVALNKGTLKGYKDSGFVEKKEWCGGTRDSHVTAYAKYSGDGAIPINEDFHVGAGSGPCPGSIGLPEEDINCSCCTIPVLRED